MAYRPPIPAARPEQRGQLALEGQPGPAGETPHIERVRAVTNGTGDLTWTYATAFGAQPVVVATLEHTADSQVSVVSHTAVGPNYTAVVFKAYAGGVAANAKWLNAIAMEPA